MYSPIILVDDKHLPLYRVVWVSDVPHFCGEDDCMHEGEYEVRLDVDDSLWVGHKQRDHVVAELNKWCSDPEDDTDDIV